MSADDEAANPGPPPDTSHVVLAASCFECGSTVPMPPGAETVTCPGCGATCRVPQIAAAAGPPPPEPRTWADAPPRNETEAWQLARRREVTQMAAAIAQGLCLIRVKQSEDDELANPAPISQVADDAYEIALRIFSRSERSFGRAP